MMKKVLLFTTLALLMFTACKEDTDWTVYDGNYSVDNNTTITLNGNRVTLSDYENASINITTGEDNSCTVVLRNFINGQPEVTIPATLSTGTKLAAGATFEGTGSTADRNLTISGVTGENTIESITITEEITVSGVIGRWSVSGVSFTLSHPDLDAFDFSEIVPGLTIPIDSVIATLNETIAAEFEYAGARSDYMHLTEDGYINFGSSEPNYVPFFEDDILCYYLRPDESILNVYLRKSVMEEVAAEVAADQSLSEAFTLLGLNALTDNPQSMSIAFRYSTEGGYLNLTASQDLLQPYRPLLDQPLALIRTYLQEMTYEDFTGLIGEFEGITAENFPKIQEKALQMFDTLTNGQTRYSISIDYVPFMR